jgi:hypothetical protein
MKTHVINSEKYMDALHVLPHSASAFVYSERPLSSFTTAVLTFHLSPGGAMSLSYQNTKMLE